MTDVEQVSTSSTRIFLGWDAPVVAKVSEYLIGANPSGLQDLGHLLVVVPTRQAGRRLREALAVHAEANGGAVINPQVVTPNHFMMTRADQETMANPMLVDALWADLLQQSPEADLKALFPQGGLDRSFSWGLSFAAMIQDLRNNLLDGAFQIGDVCSLADVELTEPGRWKQLAGLEQAYLKKLAELKLQDPVSGKIASALEPQLSDGIERIVLACVPDPTPILLHSMDKLSDQLPIEVLIHAPEDRANSFDEWGRPLPEIWTRAEMDIPDAADNLVLAANPAQQARQVIRLLAGCSEQYGPADIAIGVPDQTVAPFLNVELEEQGLVPFDPAGKSVVDEPLFDLLQRYANFLSDASYRSFSELLRHPQLLTHLEVSHELISRNLLTELDEFQNRYLPMDFQDMGRRVESNSSLGKSVKVLADFTTHFEKESLDGSLRHFLQTVYSSRTVHSSNPDDEPFISTAKTVDALLRRFRDEVLPQVNLSKQDAFRLFMQHLSRERFYPEKEGALVDLEGWLELPWNNAALLLVTGMNEGCVPDGRLSDVFLPDSLRKQLRIRSDVERLARDVYLLQTLVSSRAAEGRVCLIAGKNSTLGDPLKPSRLLFRCADDKLVAQVQRFFAEVEEERTTCPATVSFKLNPVLQDEGIEKRLSKMSVTRFRGYLRCPFRYYLSRGLNMAELNDNKTEMDAMDFGNLIHSTLEQLAGNDTLVNSTDDELISGFLQDGVKERIRQRYGEQPSLSVTFQLQGLQQRLGAAARVHAQLVRDGWQIIASEQLIKGEINGMPVTGKIDRIDRHRETGVIRLIDYKTSDRADSPDKTHLERIREDSADYAHSTDGKKQWADLQLPLYQLLYEAQSASKASIEIGYFVLPKAVGETGLKMWEGWNPELLASAKRCAEGVIGDIQSRRFWPPSTQVKYDDFGALLPAAADACFDVDALRAYMEAGS